FALPAAGQHSANGWLPSVSLGWGYNDLTQDENVITSYNRASNISASQSWAVALEWGDVFWKGNAFGMAVGQPVFATSLRDGNTPDDGNYVWEWWYKFQVTDNISVTPAVYYLSAPLGQLQKDESRSLNNFGGLVKTTFRF
ncbi:MAG: carbohydrate porin, partial [Cyanobacteriota bacterium]